MIAFDLMPPRSLTRGTPICNADGRRGLVCLILKGRLERGGEGAEIAWDNGEHDIASVVDSIDLRIDLEHLAGFATALRCANQELGSIKAARSRVSAVAKEHDIRRGPSKTHVSWQRLTDVAGGFHEATDAERETLARVLQSVST